MHINSKVEEWKELGYTDIAKIFQQIKWKEHNDRVNKNINKKIKHIFGKGQFSQLKYILVKRDKQWVKMCSPQEIEKTIIQCNLLYFGQASNTPFALKKHGTSPDGIVSLGYVKIYCQEKTTPT